MRSIQRLERFSRYLKAFFSMLVTVAMYILLGKMAASKHEDTARQRLQANGFHGNTEASLLQPESLRLASDSNPFLPQTALYIGWHKR